MITQQKIKKYFFIFLLLEIFFSYAPAFAQANPTYDYSKAGVSDQIKKYLCSPDAEGASGSGILYQCINQLYKFAIVLASVVGVFFIVIAGYVYMSSDGNTEAVDKAKSILETTIVSLVILLAGFILLKAINPDLIEFKSVQPPAVTGIELGTTGVPAGTSGLPSNLNKSCQQSFSTIPATGCTYGSLGGSCRNVNGLTSTRDCSSAGGNCYLSESGASHAGVFINTFNKIASAASSGCSLRISSAIQANQKISRSTCHAPGNNDTGTCADFNLLPSASGVCVGEFYLAAQQSGTIKSLLNEYDSACVKDSTTGGNIHVNF